MARNGTLIPFQQFRRFVRCHTGFLIMIIRPHAGWLSLSSKIEPPRKA